MDEGGYGCEHLGLVVKYPVIRVGLSDMHGISDQHHDLMYIRSVSRKSSIVSGNPEHKSRTGKRVLVRKLLQWPSQNHQYK